MDKYKPGTVFELYKNDSQEYMIVNNVEKDETVYLLVVPVYKEDGKIKTDYTKVILLNVNKQTDDMKIETNLDIIKEIVNITFQKLED